MRRSSVRFRWATRWATRWVAPAQRPLPILKRVLILIFPGQEPAPIGRTDGTRFGLCWPKGPTLALRTSAWGEAPVMAVPGDEMASRAEGHSHLRSSDS